MMDNNKISNFLNDNFNLGRDSAAFNQLTQECLNLPFYVSKKGNLKPRNSYKHPTPYDFGFFKAYTGLSTGAISKRLGMDSRDFSHVISQKNFEKGNKIPSAIWCQLIEATGLSERLILTPRYIDVRDEVLMTSQTLPTKHELFSLINISSHTLESLSQSTGIDIELLKKNCYKGSLSYDRSFNYIKPDLENNLSKIHTTDIELSVSQWQLIREALGIKGISFIKTPPAIRNSCLSTDMSIFMPSVYSKKRMEIMKQKDYVSIEDYQATNHALAERSNDTEQAHFVTNAEPYTPPTPKELRQFIFWTGYTFEELSTLLGIKPKELGFLTSVHAYDHHVYRNKNTKRLTNKHDPDAIKSKPTVKYIPYYMWRRLLETFNLVHQQPIAPISN